MYQPMLYLHWRQVRAVLALFVVSAFALPLLSIQGLGTPPGQSAVSLTTYYIVDSAQVWLPFFPLLAAAVGITLALSAWNWDHQQNHVYALSLPLTRWEYTLHKMAAGATLALVPAAALLLGAHLATWSVDLPAGLRAYPTELAARFLFGSLLAYAAFFAMAAGTIRTTLWVLGLALGFVFFGAIGSDYVTQWMGNEHAANLVEVVYDLLTNPGGPFEIFTGNWALIDV